MQYRSSEIRAGAFLLTAFTILVVMVFAVSDIQSLFKQKKDVRVSFSAGDGIEKNAPVRYSGMKVGKVADVRVAPEYNDRVVLTLSVYRDTVIKEDTKAAIKTLGLVGGKYVELSSGTPLAKPLGEGQLLKGEESLKLEDLTRMGAEIAGKLKNIATNADRVLGDPDTAKALKAMVQNLQDITANIKVITSSKEEVALGLKNLPEILNKLEAITGNLKEITDKADKLMGENRKNIDSTIENVREMTKNLRETTEEVKKAPWKLLRKP